MSLQHYFPWWWDWGCSCSCFVSGVDAPVTSISTGSGGDVPVASTSTGVGSVALTSTGASSGVVSTGAGCGVVFDWSFCPRLLVPRLVSGITGGTGRLAR